MSLPFNTDFNAMVNSFNKTSIDYTQVSRDSNNNSIDAWYLVSDSV